MSDTYSSIPVREIYDMEIEELEDLNDEEWDALYKDMMLRIKRKRGNRFPKEQE